MSNFKYPFRVMNSVFRFKKIDSNIYNTQKRFLNLHEYQSHDLFRKYNITVPRGREARSVDEAVEIAKSFGGADAVVKAQVLAGGRGKGRFSNGFEGGVHLTFDLNDVRRVASSMIGQTLITKQTGSRGRPCNEVYVQERLYSRRETYFSILLDRKSGTIVLMGSKKGGMNIEEVARDSPQDITKISVESNPQLDSKVAETLAKDMGFSTVSQARASEEIKKLYKLFIENDCTLLEINPMIETPDFKVVCADAKINIDDNSEFRNKTLFDLKDESQEDPRDVKAAKFGLNYIGLDGDIGCIVNGAGLAMATMDIIKAYGGEPANFLDVGGSATKQQIYEALQIINSDHRVHSILINVFGGIMRCDTIAQGLIEAVKEGGFNIPIILRLDGTNAKEGLELVKNSGLDRIIISKDLDDASRKSVLLSKITDASNKLGVRVSFSPIIKEQV